MNNELNEWLQLQTKQVQQNVEIVNRGENEGPLLHLSGNGDIKNFIPRLPETRTSQDSVTVPRVCVSRDIISAILAHGRMHYDATIEGIWKYYIYAFDWESALIPTSKIAGIADHANGSELWLVNYNKEHVYIKGDIIGEVHIVGVLTGPSKKDDLSVVLHGVIKTKVNIPFYQKEEFGLESGQAYQFSLDLYAKNYNKYDDDCLDCQSLILLVVNLVVFISF